MTNQHTYSGSFLSMVAKRVSEMSQENIANLHLIFTNRRAIKYFDKEYQSIKQGVFFLPECDTIDDFVRRHSPYTEADELSLIYLLYTCYQQVWYSHNPLAEGEERESFENFYFWGKTILSDFDDVDKNLADAAKLYTTLSEEKEIEDMFEFLDQNQKDILSQYFADFKKLYSTESKLKQNFTKVWNCLFEVYSLYKQTLVEYGIAYSGMIYRDLVERLEAEEENFADDIFAFVGFNVLNSSERAIFHHIKDKHTTLYFWDYDTYYTSNRLNEAGLFMRKNIEEFPHDESFSQNNFSKIASNDGSLNIISTTYSVSQTSYISQWIGRLESEYGESLQQNRMAIILNDENLLPFVLKALPEQINGMTTRVNITMGYPFSLSTLYEQIADYLSEMSVKDKSTAKQLNELKDFLTVKALTPDCEPKDKEACFASIRTIEQFERTLDFVGEDLPKNFVAKTLLRLLQKQSMPFASDATDGIQIMGLLESRSLDFDHILMLSTTDSKIPAVSNTITFIPHSLRQCFNLTTDEKKVAVFAYYFYRLLHNARNIDYVFNTVSANKDTEEMSCFLQQLRVESARPVNYLDLEQNKSVEHIEPYLPPKDAATVQMLLCGKRTDESEQAFFSASYLNDYIACPLGFFYERVLKLSISKLDEDYTYLAFGNLFHGAAERFEQSKRTKTFSDCVDESFEQLKEEEKVLMLQMHRNMAATYLENLAAYDAYNPSRSFIAAEKEVKKSVEVNGTRLNFGGLIDRIDSEDGMLVLCDYKTGGSEEKFKTVEALFDPSDKERAKYLFQIMFYAWLLWRGNPIKLEIIYIHKLKSSDNKVKSYIYDRQTHEAFDRQMKQLMTSMLSEDVGGWRADGNEDVCRYCDYADICTKDIKNSNDD